MRLWVALELCKMSESAFPIFKRMMRLNGRTNSKVRRLWYSMRGTPGFSICIALVGSKEVFAAI